MTHSTTPNTTRKKTFAKRLVVWSIAILSLVIVLVAVLAVASRPPAFIELPLGDGRILQIEGVTYGIDHTMGKDSPFRRFRPWLPNILSIGLDRGKSHLTLERPGLVVWVNAIDAVSRTNVDCQKIRVEFVDKNGDVFGNYDGRWWGGQTFWRQAFVFQCYPREESQLTLHVTTWNEGVTSSTKLLNPNPTNLANWSGESLPQTKGVGKLDVRLINLTARTNGLGRNSYYESPATYFEPHFEILERDQPATGWDMPEWLAESPNGNHGQFLGTHQPTLRFMTTIYPAATNTRVAQLIATLPRTDVPAMTTNLHWNITNNFDSNTLTVLGLFPRGTHTFSEGSYETSSPTVNGPRGGSPSGWTWGSKPITPFKSKDYANHYTPFPVIYVKWDQASPIRKGMVKDRTSVATERLAIRLRDDSGACWVAKAGNAQNGVQPFLIELPPGVTNVVPELVLLKPVTATFMVDTKNASLP